MDSTLTSTSIDNQAFHSFLSAWNAHHRLQYGGASIAELAASRAELDSLRLALR